MPEQFLYTLKMGALQGEFKIMSKVITEDSSEAILLPKSLVDKITKRVSNSEFKSVSEYVAFVLEQLLAKVEEKSSISKQDEEKIEQRLKDLGYL